MTGLSAAAQAVWRAHEQVLGDECVLTKTDMEALAAALRAVADQCKIEWNYHPDYPETESVVVVSELLGIADELERQ
jgi:hypothetical protein